MRNTIVLCLALLGGVMPAQSGLRVNEVSTGTWDWVEIANLGGVTVHLGGYKIFAGGSVSGSFVVAQYTFPQGLMLAPNQFLVITDDPANQQPAVPSGVFRAYFGVDLVWSNVPGASGSGQATLTDPSSFGIDTVRWGGVLPDISLGAAFSGYVPLGTIMRRTSNADTNASSDWFATSAGGASPGTFNLGQTFVPVLQTTVSSTGLGDLVLNVVTLTPAVPNAEIFNLVSLVDTVPNGSGPLFGIDASAIFQLLTPLSVGNPFHTLLDGSGQWALSAPPGTLPHLHAEFVSLLIEGGALTRTSGVVTVDT